MRVLPLTGIVAFILGPVLAEKWNFLKDGDRKKFEKKKEFRNVEEFKKENYEKYSKYDIKKFNNQYSEPTTEKFLKNEKDQLCQSLEEDNVKNSLLKFGLITHLIEDVNKFKKSMKTMSGSAQKIGFKRKPDKPVKARARTDKEMIKQKGGTKVKLQQSNFVGRSLRLRSPLKVFYDDEGTNFLEEQVERRKRDTKLTRGRKGTLKIPLGQVPKCYGWKYLKALDALMDDKTVDTDYLSQSMSEMLDMSFSSAVSEIFEECEEALLTGEPVCPALPYPEKEEEMEKEKVEEEKEKEKVEEEKEKEKEDTRGGSKCPNKCTPGTLSAQSADCAYGEICCKALCGGFKCIKPGETDKNEKSEKCGLGDTFMQCVYQKIDTKICSEG